MPNVRSLRNSEPYKAILNSIQRLLRESRPLTEQEKEYQVQVAAWLQESADVYRRAKELATSVSTEAAEKLLQEHNKKKPRRPKGQRRTHALPRTTEVEALVVYELASLALKQLHGKEVERKRFISTAVSQLQRG